MVYGGPGSAMGNAIGAGGGRMGGGALGGTGGMPGGQGGGGPGGMGGRGVKAGRPGPAVDMSWTSGSRKGVGNGNVGPVGAGVSTRDLADYLGARSTFGAPADDFGTRLANFAAGQQGFNEIDPRSQPPGSRSAVGQGADWGYDPAGFLGGLAGMAFGGPLGLGVNAAGSFLGRQISNAFGQPLSVNLGPNVFGGIARNMQAPHYGQGYGNPFDHAGPPNRRY